MLVTGSGGGKLPSPTNRSVVLDELARVGYVLDELGMLHLGGSCGEHVREGHEASSFEGHPKFSDER